MEEIKEVKKMETKDEEKEKKVEANKTTSKEPKKTTTTKKQTTENKTNKEKGTIKTTTTKSNTSKTTTKKATNAKQTTKKGTNAKTTNNKEIASSKVDNKKSETINEDTNKTTTKKNTTTKNASSKTKSAVNKTNKEISTEEVKKQQNKTANKKDVEIKPKKEDIEKKIDEEVETVINEEQIQEQKVEPNEQEIVEENVTMEEESINPKENEEIKPKKKHSKVFIIFSILVIIAIMAFSTIFALMNKVSDKIVYGVSIKGIDVSGLTIEQATDKMNMAFEEQWKKDITLKYEDFETVVTPEQIEMNFNVDEAVKLAYGIGRTGSILKDNYSIINANISKQEINVGYSYNEDALTDFITSTGGNLPNLVRQSSYSIDGSNLIIDKGEKGICIEEEALKKQIVQECSTLRRKSSYTNFNFRKGTRCN